MLLAGRALACALEAEGGREWRVLSRAVRAQIFYKALMGFRPSVPPDMHVGLKTLMEECWHADPNRRPAIADVLARLRVHALPACLGLLLGSGYMLAL